MKGHVQKWADMTSISDDNEVCAEFKCVNKH